MPAPREGPVGSVPCLGCGCLCDDIVVRNEDGRPSGFEPACAIGRAWFEAAELRACVAPVACVDGEAASVDQAVARAAEVLRRARAPVIFGLTTTTTETIREALGLADRIGARVILNRDPAEFARVAAYQNVGRIGATLGEIRNRADLVVFWGCDPATTHPRHAERYSIEPEGRFVPEGRSGRKIVLVDEKPTATSEWADVFIPWPADRDVALLSALRAHVRGRPDQREHVAAALGPDRPVLEELAARLTGARYGALFYRSRGEREGNARLDYEAAAGLVRSLCEVTRFVQLGLGSSGNVTGAEAGLTWQAGFPQGIDFGPGWPRPIDESPTLESILDAGETDAILVVADAYPARLSESARGCLARIPIVVIAPDATQRNGPRPTVGLTSGVCGIDVKGTVTRVDGVVLPLRPLRAPRYPDDLSWIRKIGLAMGDAHESTHV